VCVSGDLCSNHDTLGWCANTTLSSCSLLRPLNGGDCKLPSNLLAIYGSPAATASGVFYGPSAICVGVPNQKLSRPGATTIKVNEVFSSSSASACCHSSLQLSDERFFFFWDSHAGPYLISLCGVN
jgi:hypothetical protein